VGVCVCGMLNGVCVLDLQKIEDEGMEGGGVGCGGRGEMPQLGASILVGGFEGVVVLTHQSDAFQGFPKDRGCWTPKAAARI